MAEEASLEIDVRMRDAAVASAEITRSMRWNSNRPLSVAADFKGHDGHCLR